jgi:hypothetical protein
VRDRKRHHYEGHHGDIQENGLYDCTIAGATWICCWRQTNLCILIQILHVWESTGNEHRNYRWQVKMYVNQATEGSQTFSYNSAVNLPNYLQLFASIIFL